MSAQEPDIMFAAVFLVLERDGWDQDAQCRVQCFRSALICAVYC